jgi:hypothetical protein
MKLSLIIGAVAALMAIAPLANAAPHHRVVHKRVVHKHVVHHRPVHKKLELRR